MEMRTKHVLRTYAPYIAVELLSIALAAAGIAANSAIAVAVSVLASAAAPLSLILALRSERATGEEAKGLRTRLIASERRIGTWKQAAVAARAREEELAGQIVNVIRHVARISSDTVQVHHRMDAFDDSFKATFEDLKTIKDSVGELDNAIGDTAAATEQTSAAVEEISASIQRVSDIASQRAAEVRSLSETAVSGQGEMTATQATIEKINKGIDDLHGFIGIIDDIAGRTSILSMNAAIQAAHAGEAGKGFAVVADEIRRLAESTTQNAASINRRLEELIRGIRQAEGASKSSSQMFAKVESESRAAADSFLEIEQGMKELALGSREILAAVLNLRETSQQLQENSSSVSGASSSILGTVDGLVSSSLALSSSVQNIQARTEDLNMAGLTLSQADTALMLESTKAYGQGSEHGISASVLRLQHIAWVARVRGAIDGKLALDIKSLGDHTTCDLGKWLSAKGASVLDPETVREFDAKHRRLHQLVGEIAGLMDEGKIQEAEDSFKALEEASQDVVACIDKNIEGKLGDKESFIRWIPEFSVGKEEIDIQHKKLVALINELGLAIRGGRGTDAMGKVLSELVNYAATHFSDEEQYFLATKYPDREAHIKAHRAFTAQALKLKSDFESGHVVLGSETLNFLRSWLSDHILGTDKGYAAYL